MWTNISIISNTKSCLNLLSFQFYSSTVSALLVMPWRHLPSITFIKRSSLLINVDIFEFSFRFHISSFAKFVWLTHFANSIFRRQFIRLLRERINFIEVTKYILWWRHIDRYNIRAIDSNVSSFTCLTR